MKRGLLVLPKLKNLQYSSLYLTPLDAFDAERVDKWIEWKAGEFGIVLGLSEQVGVLVMTSNGIGLCFYDELEEA